VEALGLLEKEGGSASDGVARFLYPHESGGGPVRALPEAAVAVSACGLAV
jgi:hypothetical protein